MAENDAEIDIGVNLDSDSFRSEYQALLKDLSTQTRKVIKDAVTGLSGAASKDWGELPFADMHSSVAGNRVATQAFLSSLAYDLKSQGIGPGSLGYQSALLNATYRATTSDPWQRYHQMLASGFTQQADATHPDSALGRTIDTDYALMSQSWARQFITKTGSMYRGKAGQVVDFAGMRNYAVDAGLGRWIDPDKEHTADNFELINDELEKIEDNSNKSEKTFTGWNDTLKNVLGTLTAIGSLTGIAKTFEIAYGASEQGTVQAGTSLPRTRAFLGMSALDVLAAQNASQSVGLGKDAIYNEIADLSNKREEYKLLGQGLDALFPSLSGTFDNIMSGDNPYEAYKSIIKELYGTLQGADDDTRAQALMLLDKQGLGSASYIIGSFLSNPTLAAEMGNDPTKLFSLLENPYRGSYGRGEALLPDIVQLNESIKASYNQMYEDWEEAFGLPFKGWWNKTLINTVVPWFEKMLSYASPEERKKRSEESGYKLATAAIDAVDPKKALRNDQTITDARIRGSVAEVLTGNYNGWSDIVHTNYLGPDKIQGLFGGIAWNTVKQVTDFDPNKDGKDSPKKWLAALTKMASEKAYKSNLTGLDEDYAVILQDRAHSALKFLDQSGLYSRLNDLDYGQDDTAIIRLLQKYLQSGDESLLDSFLYNTYTSTDDWKKIIKFVEDNSEYLSKHPQDVLDIKITLFDEYGRKLQADVDKTINRN